MGTKKCVVTQGGIDWFYKWGSRVEVYGHTECGTYFTGTLKDGEVVRIEEELWEADKDCRHVIKSARGGGVKCVKCKGWFCY